MLQLSTCMQIKTAIQPNRFTNHIHNTHVVPISTRGMLAHILTDCSKGTGEGQGEEEDDTKEGEGGGDYLLEDMEGHGQLASLGSDYQPAGEWS